MSRPGGQYVQKHDKKQQKHNRPNGFENRIHRNRRQDAKKNNNCKGRKQSRHRRHHEYGNHVEEAEYDFYSGIQTMQNGIALVIPADRNILNHEHHPEVFPALFVHFRYGCHVRHESTHPQHRPG